MIFCGLAEMHVYKMVKWQNDLALIIYLIVYWNYYSPLKKC
jgi:hypothetical protein